MLAASAIKPSAKARTYRGYRANPVICAEAISLDVCAERDGEDGVNAGKESRDPDVARVVILRYCAETILGWEAGDV